MGGGGVGGVGGGGGPLLQGCRVGIQVLGSGASPARSTGCGKDGLSGHRMPNPTSTLNPEMP